MFYMSNMVHAFIKYHQHKQEISTTTTACSTSLCGKQATNIYKMQLPLRNAPDKRPRKHLRQVTVYLYVLQFCYARNLPVACRVVCCGPNRLGPQHKEPAAPLLSALCKFFHCFLLSQFLTSLQTSFIWRGNPTHFQNAVTMRHNNR